MTATQATASSGWAITRRLARSDRVTTLAVAVFAVVIILAVIGPWVTPYAPDAIDVANTLAGPSAGHWLGTDQTGRDIFSRLLAGTRATMLGPLFVMLISTTLGTLLAVLAAWHGGWIDTLISRAIDIMFAFPGIVVAIIGVTIFGRGLVAPVVALSLTFVPMVARVLRTAALRERTLPYVAALRVQGASGTGIVLRHLVPNLLPIVVVQATMGFGYALLDLAAISYLGLGLQPPDTDWGLLISNGQSGIIGGHPVQSVSAALAVLLTVIAVNLIGDRLAAHYEIGQR